VIANLTPLESSSGIKDQSFAKEENEIVEKTINFIIEPLVKQLSELRYK
jgi:hypothetical protein